MLNGSVVADSLQPHGLWLARLPIHGIIPARKVEWVAIPSPGHLPDPEIESMSHALAVKFFNAEPPVNIIYANQQLRMINNGILNCI